MPEFSEASRQLHITQSTLSQQTRQLEDELGVQLFSRDSHHVELTDVGSAFLPSALRASPKWRLVWTVSAK